MALAGPRQSQRSRSKRPLAAPGKASECRGVHVTSGVPRRPRTRAGTAAMAAGGPCGLCSRAPRTFLAAALCARGCVLRGEPRLGSSELRFGPDMQTPDPSCRGVGPLCCPGLCGRAKGPGLPEDLPALSTRMVPNCLKTINVSRSLLFVMKWQKWPVIPLFKKNNA